MALIDYPRALDDLANESYEIAEAHGFHDDDLPPEADIPRKIALIHSEASEALAVLRAPYDDDQPDAISSMTPMQEDDFCEEIADILIRCFDLAGAYSLNLGEVTIAKMEKNRSRPRLHSKRF